MTNLDLDHAEHITGGSIPMSQKSLDDWFIPFGCNIPFVLC